MATSAYIKPFSAINIGDVAIVGGKNASLGEMRNHLAARGIPVPDGFATTSFAFEDFLTQNHLHQPLSDLMQQLDRRQYSNLREIGEKARQLILHGYFTKHFEEELLQYYQQLGGGQPIAVAVRSSATAEDLPQASFAGQHESYLNIQGNEAVLTAVKQCFASLYTNRAIKYREDNGFAHEKVALSVGVQVMVRSDLAAAGVAFTLEPESGFRDIIHISGVWGLGENIVQGTVTPDEFFVFKPTLATNKQAIIQKKLGEKALMMIYSKESGLSQSTENIPTPAEKQASFVLSDQEVLQLAKWCQIIESHYQKAMDIEWAKDGISQSLFILQARPETVHSRQTRSELTSYSLTEKGTVLTSGNAVGSKAATGIARILHSTADAHKVQQGEIVVTEITSPDWDPILKQAGAIITNKGGRTSHASIVARELGVPAIVGCGDATEKIRDGATITVSCCEGRTGFVYDGKLNIATTRIDLNSTPKPQRTQVMMIAGDPEQAFKLSFYPNDGVGLLRMEFIITHAIQIHPMALVKFDQIRDETTRSKIEFITRNYTDKKQFFIDQLAQGIATIAAAFYPKPVIVRMSDFKTNEYANLIGGIDFEPKEENPMLGFRGASRYYSEAYREGFDLECAAIRVVRDKMGLTNLKLMIPFCRTVDEGQKVIEVMRQNGIDRASDPDLEIYVMAEIPSNVILADEFARIFDGFSIGSNDLTQLVLGIDRDSATVSQLFSEQNAAVKKMIAEVVHKANAAGKKIGLCGQAPSDYPEFAQFLVEQGIDSISFNPDAIISGINNILKAEAKEN